MRSGAALSVCQALDLFEDLRKTVLVERTAGSRKGNLIRSYRPGDLLQNIIAVFFQSGTMAVPNMVVSSAKMRMIHKFALLFHKV